MFLCTCAFEIKLQLVSLVWSTWFGVKGCGRNMECLIECFGTSKGRVHSTVSVLRYYVGEHAVLLQSVATADSLGVGVYKVHQN